MNKSDYDKYYKKGGTYVIPVEIFNELFDELERLKEINKELGRDYSSANNGYLRLHSIIKEVREEIRILRTNCDISNVHAMKLFQTLDKVDKEKSDE